MDIYDMATLKEEQERETVLAMARGRAPSITANGRCHNCNERLEPKHLFCNSDCRDDWQARNPNK